MRPFLTLHSGLGYPLRFHSMKPFFALFCAIGGASEVSMHCIFLYAWRNLPCYLNAAFSSPSSPNVVQFSDKQWLFLDNR
jgi:hypothetical protein